MNRRYHWMDVENLLGSGARHKQTRDLSTRTRRSQRRRRENRGVSHRQEARRPRNIKPPLLPSRVALHDQKIPLSPLFATLTRQIAVSPLLAHTSLTTPRGGG